MSQVVIAGRQIGRGTPPFIVAELSGNHRGKIEEATRLIDAAVHAGADAVKLQTYTPETITMESDRDAFKISGGPWAGMRLHDLYVSAHTPWEWHETLFAHARARGITLFSSPFDVTAVDLLESLDCPAYKIASFEAADLPLIAKAASTGKPLIVSTGLTSEQEIVDVTETAKKNGAGGLVLLHCVSVYPAPVDEMNLRTVPELGARFGVPAGLSDHSLGDTAAIAAVALGAVLIEKHLTLDRSAGGPDASFSMEPSEFRDLVQRCRETWEAMGTVHFGATKSAEQNRALRRSLYVVKDMRSGESFSDENVRSIRPAEGLPPKHLPEIIGKRASRDIERGTPLRWELISTIAREEH